MFENFNKNQERIRAAKAGEEGGKTENEDWQKRVESLNRGHNPEEAYAERIAGAPNFQELMRVIGEVGAITGADDYVYDVSHLNNAIGKVSLGESGPETITRTHGLRQRVEELLAVQRIKEKYK